MDTNKPDDSMKGMLKGEAHAALQALAEVGLHDISNQVLARRLDALGSAWGEARRRTPWSTGMERGLDTMLTALREAKVLALGGGMPASELGARVAVVLADKAHPERPAVLKAFKGALDAGHVVMKAPRPPPPEASPLGWTQLRVIEGHRCVECHGEVRSTQVGVLCVRGHQGAELDPNADRPAPRA